MQRRVLTLLWDIHNAARNIRQFATGRSLPEYQGNIMLRSAIERQFEIVGEALRQLLEEVPEMESSISHTSEIIGFRNVLAHGYATISDEVVWDIVETDIPVLLREVDTLLES